MKKNLTETSLNLKRYHEGEQDGLDTLLERHLPWLREKVRERLSPLLRRRGDSEDFAQDAVVQFLQHAPRFTISDEKHFRGLLFTIVKNLICNKYDWFTAQRRKLSLERPLNSDSVLCLDPPRDKVKTPSVSAQRREGEAWVRFGLELLDPDDREVILLRRWEDLSFAEIGKQLDVKEDAARMRHNRAVSRLSEIVWDLRQGNLERFVGEE